MTTIIAEKESQKQPFDRKRLSRFIERVADLNCPAYIDKVVRVIESKNEYHKDHITGLLIQAALENTDEANPDWTYTAAKIYLANLYKQASINRSYDKKQKYGDFYQLIKQLTDFGIYSTRLLEKYSEKEIRELEQIIDPERDLLFDYIGLHTLATRYLATDHEKMFMNCRKNAG